MPEEAQPQADLWSSSARSPPFQGERPPAAPLCRAPCPFPLSSPCAPLLCFGVPSPFSVQTVSGVWPQLFGRKRLSLLVGSPTASKEERAVFCLEKKRAEQRTRALRTEKGGGTEHRSREGASRGRKREGAGGPAQKPGSRRTPSRLRSKGLRLCLQRRTSNYGFNTGGPA
jgi:hypothetical protein